MHFVALARLKKLGYNFKEESLSDTNLIELAKTWENSENGPSKYKLVKSTDSIMDIESIYCSLLSRLNSDTKIITKAKYKLISKHNKTHVKLNKHTIKPDLLIIASGKNLPLHIKELGFNDESRNIKSTKSPILVLKKALNYPNFVRFTPNAEDIFNHIKIRVNNNYISTLGSYTRINLDEEINQKDYQEIMCKKLGIDINEIAGCYWGIKTEHIKMKKRKYDHVIMKLNDNTFFALAGKFSQFPLLVEEFADLTSLSLKASAYDKLTVNKEQIFPSLINRIIKKQS
ncbi:MAG: hypothetical protein ABIA04_04005 [Pseudomonadota bacterium]